MGLEVTQVGLRSYHLLVGKSLSLLILSFPICNVRVIQENNSRGYFTGLCIINDVNGKY